MVVGVLESSSVSSHVGQRCPVWKPSWQSRCGKRGPSHAEATGPCRKPLFGEPGIGLGSLKKGTQFAQKWHSGLESRGSHRHRQ